MFFVLKLLQCSPTFSRTGPPPFHPSHSQPTAHSCLPLKASRVTHVLFFQTACKNEVMSVCRCWTSFRKKTHVYYCVCVYLCFLYHKKMIIDLAITFLQKNTYPLSLSHTHTRARTQTHTHHTHAYTHFHFLTLHKSLKHLLLNG